MLNCLAVGLGGFAGSVCRYLMGLLPLGRNWAFPIRTLAINLIGSFVIGAVTALALKRSDPDPRLVLFLKAGVCGGFTTFSSFGPALRGRQSDAGRPGRLRRGGGGALRGLEPPRKKC